MATISVSVSEPSLTAAVTQPYTMTAADFQSLLEWAVKFPTMPNPTHEQILLAWIQSWMDRTINEIQVSNAQPYTLPPPISITPQGRVVSSSRHVLRGD